MSTNNSIFKIVISACLALGIGFGGGFSLGQLYSSQFGSPSEDFQVVKTPRRMLSSTISYAPAVDKANSAVVNVFSEKTVRSISPLQLFWGDILNQNSYGFPPVSRSQRSLGSGVIISKDGYVLTNSHVIRDASKIQVALSSGKEFNAKLIGADSKTDLALLKIEDKNLPHIPFADSEQVETGDVVLAIGNPFGIGQTVTMGIVSAKKRENLGLLDYEDFIQTDAAINPGNSGGALVDSKGNLIGINTALFSKSGGYQGIGFAVPSNLAKKIAEDLRKNGKVKRSFLGVSVINLQEEINPLTAYLLKKGYERGALVIKVQQNGPADRAGVKQGTLITKVNNIQIESSEKLFKLVSESSPEKALDIQAIVVDIETGKISKENYSVKPQVN
ncbi:MAG: trypsin-like peptidase domain-containing protein [Candidatus Caenarcaniphilales bacterium]|nr:trypsin-like peptidase domain-containing protein [Candidatus Caenarcaniphilales bacterium]